MNDFYHKNKIDFDHYGQNQNVVVTIDTRDFEYYLNEYHPDNKENISYDVREIKKKYFGKFTKEEVLSFVERLFNESGGEGRWRMITFNQITEIDWCKYLVIYRYDDIYYIRSGEYWFDKSDLEKVINKKHLNFCKN